MAIAVNGRIRAVSRTFKLATGGGELLAALVPRDELPQAAAMSPTLRSA